MTSTMADGGRRFLSAQGWEDLDVRALLVTSAQAHDDTLTYVSELVGEVSGGGYARVALTGRAATWTDDADGARYVCTADDVVFSTIDVGAVDKVVLFSQVTNDADSPVLAMFDIRTAGGGTVSTDGGDLTLPPDTVNGFVTIS